MTAAPQPFSKSGQFVTNRGGLVLIDEWFVTRTSNARCGFLAAPRQNDVVQCSVEQRRVSHPLAAGSGWSGLVMYVPENVWRRFLLSLVLASAVAGAERIDQETNAKIRSEATGRSQLMRTVHVLADRYGPRLTRSPKGLSRNKMIRRWEGVVGSHSSSRHGICHVGS